MLDAPDLATGFATLRHGLSAGEALPEPIRQAWTRPTGKPIHEALGMSEISTYVSSCPPGRPRPARRLPATRPPHRRPRADGVDAGAARRRRRSRRLAPRPRPDARLLEPSRRNRGRFPRRMVRDRRPRPHGRGRRHHLPRPRRRPDERRRLPGQPGRGRGRAARAPRHRRRRRRRLPVPPAPRSSPPSTSRGTAPLPEAELAAHCAARLARYKCPRAFRAVAALPRSANGKLLRRAAAGARRPVPPEVPIDERRPSRDRSTGGRKACASSRRRSSTSTRRRRPA